MAEAHAASVHVKWGARTDAGCVRPANEDAVLAAPPVFVAADGMGGHAAGEVASSLAVAAFAELPGRPGLDVEALVDAVQRANQAILAEVARAPELAGMGTTLTGLALFDAGFGPCAGVVNVGDSRTYLRRNGTLAQLTKDHSLVQQLIDAGALTEEEAATHPNRNVVTRALGVGDAVEVDSLVVPLVAGDRFLVCTDGLTAALEPPAIEEALGQEPDPAAVTDQLIAAAIAAGAPDNVSVIVLDVLSIQVRTP